MLASGAAVRRGSWGREDAHVVVGLVTRPKGSREPLRGRICVKTGRGLLNREMPTVCRTPGCANARYDRLGHCAVCGCRYRHDRTRLDGLAAAARREHWELFTALDERDAVALAEHLVGHARLGRRTPMFAIADLLAEARELADTARGRRARPGRPVCGGAR